MTRRALVGLALLLAALAGACASRSDAPQPPEDWLSAVQAAHMTADDALADERFDQAHAALQAALDTPARADLHPDHVRVVRQDLCFRLAQIELARDDAEQALSYADRGLALGHGDDVFTANLWVARGKAQEALAQPADAATCYQQALAINQRLLRAALASDAGGP
jgi:tetratricopeptide (TPR) repeat protein